MSRVESPREHSARILSFEALEATLSLADELRPRAGVAITRRTDPNRPVICHQVFGVPPLRVLPVPLGGSACGSKPKVVGQLGLHRPLHEPLCQLGEQPAGAHDLARESRRSPSALARLPGAQPLHRLQPGDPELRHLQIGSAALRSGASRRRDAPFFAHGYTELRTDPELVTLASRRLDLTLEVA
jgi:hypothetical protein